MKHYVAAPGIVYSDEVWVYSEKIKEQYIEFLARFAGENTRTIWRERIRVVEMSDNAEEKNSKTRT